MADTFLNSRVQNKYDSVDNWLTNDPVLLEGEMGIAVFPDGTKKVKIGDGVSTFSMLSYVDPKIVHVGPEEPVDGDIFIWVDTTEDLPIIEEPKEVNEIVTMTLDDFNSLADGAKASLYAGGVRMIVVEE